jgi:bacillithiol system protein YtxJ
VTDVFEPLSSEHDLDRALADSHIAPVIVFKHSQTCGASWFAESSLAEGPWPVPVRRLVVQRQRALSARLAERLGVRHESPQALVLVDGRVAWHTSHAGVTRERVAAAWRRAAEAQRSALTA